MKSAKLPLSTAALTIGLIISGGTRADDWKPVGQVGFFAAGKAYEMEKGHFYWIGEVSGTFFNDKGEKSLFDHAGLKCPTWADINSNNKTSKAGGYCTVTDLAGDTAYLTWQNAGEPGGPSPGTFEWTGGTGKYKDIKGENTFVGHTSVNWSDGTTSSYATWNR
jgi:hypothetical protein